MSKDKITVTLSITRDANKLLAIHAAQAEQRKGEFLSQLILETLMKK